MMTDKRQRNYHDKDKYSDSISAADSNGGRSSYTGTSGTGTSGPGSSKYDDPPNSRLFIVCAKNISEEQFREAFGVFGTIEEVWVLRDRATQEPKGITYIKFSKTSEAALAMEEMNGRCVAGSPRPLKVLIAHSRDQGSRRDMNEEERLVRLFVVVPKSYNEDELRSHFSEFGDIDYVSIVRDRVSKESKGFAYIKYHRMSHAAKAFEGCERSFKPVFADPKPQKNSYSSDGGHSGGSGPGGGGNHDHHRMGGGGGGHPGHHGGGPRNGPGSTASGSSMSAYDMLSFMDTSTTNPDHCCRLSVSASSSVNQDQVWKLFDLVPGLDYCDRSSSRPSSKAYFIVVYNNPQSAAYAKEKLHGFEYPPGHRIVVKFDLAGEAMRPPAGPPLGPSGLIPGGGGGGRGGPPNGRAGGGNPGGGGGGIQSDLAHLTETIANATALLQAAGYASPGVPAGVMPVSGGPPTGMTPNPSATGTSTPANSSVSATGETYDPAYCSVKLPPPQPLAAMDSVVAERLFIVCTPVPPPLYAMKDVFGRFGNLIDIYMLNGKTCGYAKYACKESAERAIETLHGQELRGSRLKVMPAEPHEKSSSTASASSSGPGTPAEAARKRPKMDE